MANEPSDMMQAQFEAMADARDQHVELMRMARDEIVTRPATGERKTQQQRDADYAVFRADQFAIGGSFDELTARFQLTDERPFPRRLVRSLVRSEKRFRRQQEEGE